MCERTMNKLMIAARRTDVNAIINTEFCEGPIRGFSATLNGDGLKWVRIIQNFLVKMHKANSYCKYIVVCIATYFSYVAAYMIMSCELCPISLYMHIGMRETQKSQN